MLPSKSASIHSVLLILFEKLVDDDNDGDVVVDDDDDDTIVCVSGWICVCTRARTMV